MTVTTQAPVTKATKMVSSTLPTGTLNSKASNWLFPQLSFIQSQSTGFPEELSHGALMVGPECSENQTQNATQTRPLLIGSFWKSSSANVPGSRALVFQWIIHSKTGRPNDSFRETALM